MGEAGRAEASPPQRCVGARPRVTGWGGRIQNSAPIASAAPNCAAARPRPDASWPPRKKQEAREDQAAVHLGLAYARRGTGNAHMCTLLGTRPGCSAPCTDSFAPARVAGRSRCHGLFRPSPAYSQRKSSGAGGHRPLHALGRGPAAAGRNGRIHSGSIAEGVGTQARVPSGPVE